MDARRSLIPVLAAASLLALPLPASARERDTPDATVAVEHVELADTVIAHAPARAASAAGAPRAYPTVDGHSVSVSVSQAYPQDAGVDQALVDFLASRLHGPELSSLGVYVGTPGEIARICGGRYAVACYAIDEQRMYVPGEKVHGIPIEYALTHEYGHHLASWRRNNPWDALDWGAKHWSSAMRVCAHVDAGRLFPGNQGRHYLEDPGEGFADGYAHVHYPGAPWQYSAILRPDRSAFAAIRRDVLHPWTGPRTRTFRGRLGQGRSRRQYKLRFRLDGDMSVRLAGPASLRAEVEVRAPGFAAGRTLSRGGSFGIEWCRRERVEMATLTVRRRAGSGPFRLQVSWPG